MKLSLGAKSTGGSSNNKPAGGLQKPRPGASQSSLLSGFGSNSTKSLSSNGSIGKKKISALGDEEDEDDDGDNDNTQPIASTSNGPGLSRHEQRKRMDPSRPMLGSSSGTGSNKTTSRPSPASLLMGNDDDDDDNEEGKNGHTNTKPIKPTLDSSNQSNNSRILAKLHSEAKSIDPTIFSYDEVYDDMKTAQRLATEARKASKEAEGDAPKYVSGLLKAAEQRKKDRIRAEDKLIERERVNEGEDFKDKEAFVTSAYKEQQEELRRQEEEDRIKEEQAAKRPGGMSEYYKRELAQSEAIHEAAMKAASTSKISDNSADSGGINSNTSAMAEAAELAAKGPKSEAEIAREASAALGRQVTVNEEGQIVDKRELLTGGLNIKPRKTTGSIQGPSSGPPKGFALSISERRSAQEEVERKELERKKREDEASLGLTGMTIAERQRISRQRQSEELQKQLIESQEKKRALELEKENERVGKIQKRNNDESKIEELKRKALERRLAAANKKKMEEEEAVAGGAGKS